MATDKYLDSPAACLLQLVVQAYSPHFVRLGA